ncbi:transmembrane protein, putative [Bodo saltans]|uniref:Transmembrane protein, putative n=1 Tax=Bodo saltans TaxID=75058 RepID=A0A0S4JM14_BODSA|nr:transmembrane protein, putative [Bodo saltans]|eukprot:CUG91438.1 transmembrane protein, putative [Bodo saltans]
MMEQFRAVTAWCSPRGPAVIPLLERLCQNHTDDAERSAGIRECLLIRDRYSRWCVIRAALLSGVLVASIQYVLPITTISSAANSLSLPPASSSSSSRRLLKCERMFTWHWLASSIQLLNLVMTTPSPHTAIIIKNMAAAVAHTLSVLEIVDARQRTRDVVGSSRRRTVEDSIWELFKDETVLPRRPSLKCTNAYQSGLLTLPLAPAVPAGSRTPSANDLFTQYIPHLLGSVPHNNDAGVKSMLEALEWCVACTLWNQSERVVLQDSEASLRATIAEEEYEKETQSMLRLLTNGQNEIERFNEAIRLDAEVKKREADRKQAEDAAKRDEAARLLAEELQKKEELCRREADERKRRGDEQQQQQRFSQGIEIVQEVRRKSVAQRAKNMIETMLLKSAANARENLRQKAEADAEQQARSSALEEIRTRIEDRRKSSAHELARSLTLQKVTSMRNAKIATEVAQLEYNIERLVSEAHKKLQRTYDDCEKELHSLRKTAEKSRLQIVKAFEMQQRKEQQQQQAALLATAISSSAQSFVKYWSVLEVDEDDDEQQTPPPSSSQQQRQHLHTPSSAREHHQAARKRGSTVALDEALRAVMAKVVVVVTPKNNNTNMASSDVEREILDSRSSSNHRLAPQALKSFRTLQKGGGSQLQLQYVLKQHAESSVRKLMKAFPSLVALLDGLCSVVAPPPPGDNNGRFVANSSASSSSDLQRRNRLSTIPLHQQEAALLDRIERLQHGSNINGGGSVSVATSSSVRSVSGNGGGAEAAALQASSFVDSTEVMQSIVNDVATSFCTCQVTRASVTSALRILGTIAPVLSSPSRHHHRGRSNHHQLLTEVHRLQLLVTAQHLWMVPCKDSSLQVSLLPVASKLMEQTARDLLNSSGGGGGVKGNDHRDEDGDEEESLHRIPCTLLTVAALCLSITTPAGEDTAVVASWRAVSWIRLMCQLTLDVMLLKHEEAPASSTQRHQAPPPPQPPLVQFLTMSSTRSSPRSHANYQFNNNDDPNYHHQSYLAHHRDHFHQLASKSLHIALQSNLPHNAPPQRSSYERRMFDIRFENNNNTHEEHPLRLRDDVDEGNATTNAVATTGMKAAFDAFQISIGACVSTFVSLHSFAKQQQQQQAQEQLFFFAWAPHASLYSILSNIARDC